jgi:hypothetical protein
MCVLFLFSHHWIGLRSSPLHTHTHTHRQENIQFYLRACKDMGLRDMDLFSPSDLIENTYPEAVFLNLAAVRRVHHLNPHGVTVTPREHTPLLLGNQRKRSIPPLEEPSGRCACSCVIL